MYLFPSIAAAADHHHVLKTTAAYRRVGRPSVAQTDRKSQRLFNKEEKALIQYFETSRGRTYALITPGFDESSPKSCKINEIIMSGTKLGLGRTGHWGLVGE
jgi:hypothetical protein